MGLILGPIALALFALGIPGLIFAWKAIRTAPKRGRCAAQIIASALALSAAIVVVTVARRHGQRLSLAELMWDSGIAAAVNDFVLGVIPGAIALMEQTNRPRTIAAAGFIAGALVPFGWFTVLPPICHCFGITFLN